jgi:hypothetical protein
LRDGAGISFELTPSAFPLSAAKRRWRNLKAQFAALIVRFVVRAGFHELRVNAL